MGYIYIYIYQCTRRNSKHHLFTTSQHNDVPYDFPLDDKTSCTRHTLLLSCTFTTPEPNNRYINHHLPSCISYLLLLSPYYSRSIKIHPNHTTTTIYLQGST
eukprot:293834_1